MSTFTNTPNLRMNTVIRTTNTMIICTMGLSTRARHIAIGMCTRRSCTPIRIRRTATTDIRID